jgi:hypothetical protein
MNTTRSSRREQAPRHPEFSSRSLPWTSTVVPSPAEIALGCLYHDLPCRSPRFLALWEMSLSIIPKHYQITIEAVRLMSRNQRQKRALKPTTINSNDRRWSLCYLGFPCLMCAGNEISGAQLASWQPPCLYSCCWDDPGRRTKPTSFLVVINRLR